MIWSIHYIGSYPRLQCHVSLFSPLAAAIDSRSTSVPPSSGIRWQGHTLSLEDRLLIGQDRRGRGIVEDDPSFFGTVMDYST